MNSFLFFFFRCEGRAQQLFQFFVEYFQKVERFGILLFASRGETIKYFNFSALFSLITTRIIMLLALSSMQTMDVAGRAGHMAFRNSINPISFSKTTTVSIEM